ncbi:Tetratricopeptide repeat-containing protein [Humidesulfovibrio mexicanus]|uniref:Tetratricopeptide repeat-containing protein n=1 Tax=Humidesulfovibrio mexicanus TaxID=147047 RepID=A0A239CNA8_9BACT|nr:tetratricopeptide repeat protein [Humidesulfovibrio mexicanus]SNS21218.1 Tetratricopeptide repeat-containing protein [Humidesulfovibrio mexicanus]
MNTIPAEQHLTGVFFQRAFATIGTGTTTRKTEQYLYYYVRESGDDTLELHTLGPDGQPSGEKRSITREELLQSYLLEPQMSLDFARDEARRQEAVGKAVARGDRYFKQRKTFSAEFEYGKALALDVENVRANFGIGLCYLSRGERDKAREVFERLVKIDAAFEDRHKHLFNAFGISLRKAGMFAEALAYYARALELCSDDENLHYNMARAAFGNGNADSAGRHLASCLALNPRHPEALQFEAFLKRGSKAGG